MSDYRRNFSREDPRLNRSNSNTSPKTVKSPSTSNNGQPPPAEGWNAQTANYNHTQALQNAYQSIPYHNTGGHHYPTQTYYTGYQNYSYNPYENYQASQQQGAYMNVVEPRPPGEEYPHGSWTSTNNYTVTEAPPPAQPEYNNSNSEKKKTDGVAEEKIKQLAGLMKERETYENRVTNLKNKLKLLVEQKDTLSAKHSPDKDTLRIIKENTKLQVEIQGKIKDATNVIEILSNIIGDKKKKKTEEQKPPEQKQELSTSVSDKVNLKHFDPEVHWCRMCDVFPQTAKELLLHLHSKQHQEASQEQIPWHKLPPEPKFPTYEGAPIKRVPIKGLQFFVASTAWYCQLCDSWIGDLHCASQHLMSITHSQNYTNFVEQNPHWEMEWMKDREKAIDRVKRSKEDVDTTKHTRRKEKYSPSSSTEVSSKKKKKRSKRRKRRSSDESSSSSSSSSTSDDEEDKTKSIRVAMRNKLLDNDSKLELLEKLTRQSKNDDFSEDKLLSQWMTTDGEAGSRDKQLLNNLKEKLRQKHDAEKAAKAALELELARRQKERDEQERLEREQLEQETFIKEEEKKHREKMSMKLKSQSIRESRDSNSRRRSLSRSPDRRRRRSSSSPGRRTSRNGRNNYDDRSPHYDRNRRSRSREHNRTRDRRKSRSRSREHDDEKKDKKSQLNKKLPFIGRMPLFKSTKAKSKDDEVPKREIQKEDYDTPRKTRFQPGNLARAFIPQPEVVCFPQLSSYPPIPPPPPIIPVPPATPEPPKISNPNPPPPPKLVEEPPKLNSKAERALMEAAREEAPEEEPEEEPEVEGKETAESAVIQPEQDQTATEEYMLYGDTSNTMYQYGNMDYNMMYPPVASTAYNFMQVNPSNPLEVADPELPKSHTMPLEPPPLPPDDPNEDLAMLGLSSDDLAVQQMF